MPRKDHRESTAEGQADKAAAEQDDAAVASQVQENITQETEQGFRGLKVDPTPNENYTVTGVTSGAPTPETDEGAARAAAEAVRGAST